MHKALSRILAIMLMQATAHLSAQDPLFLGERLDRSGPAVSTAEARSLDEVLTSWEIYALNPALLHEHVRASGGRFTLRLAAHEWRLDLRPHDLRAAGHHVRVATDQGVMATTGVDASTYRGTVQGRSAGRARFSIRADALLGNMLVDGEEFFLEPLWQIIGGMPDGRHVVYRAQDVLENTAARCGVHFMESLPKMSEGQARGGEPCRLAHIAVAADGSMLAFLGSEEAVQTRIMDILNWVDGKYQEPAINIAYQLVATFISASTANDPWSLSTNAGVLLSSFASWGEFGGFASSDPFAVATLWTRRDIELDGNFDVAGYAYIGVVCTSDRYNLCEHYSSTAAGPMVVQTHELGHNWSAQHYLGAGDWIMGTTVSATSTEWDTDAIAAIVGHKNTRTCLGTDCQPLPVAAFFASSTTTCGGTVSFTDQSSAQPFEWLWDFGDGNTSVEQNPVHTYAADGTYTVQLTVTNAWGVDVETLDQYISVTLMPAPLTTGATICAPGGDVELSATGDNNLYWYDQPSGGELVNSGPLFQPTVTATTTWYVESSTMGPVEHVGAPDNNFDTGFHFNTNDLWGLLFDVLAPLRLESVKVYALGSGNRTLQVLRNDATVEATRVVNIPDGESRIDLSIDLQPGTNYLLKVTGPVVSLFRNAAGASFPYTAPGLVSITANNVSPTSTAYYFFYDWEVRTLGCASERSAVTANVELCSGIGEQDDVRLDLMPNPSNGECLISWDANRMAVFAEVRDALGRLVHRSPMPMVSPYRLQIAGPSGTYQVCVLDDRGQVIAKRRMVVIR